MCRTQAKLHRPEDTDLIKITLPFERMSIGIKVPFPKRNRTRYTSLLGWIDPFIKEN